MGSAIVIKKADHAAGRTARTFVHSRIARLIFASNLAGLIVLIIGALILSEMRAGLVKARVESLQTQGDLVASVIADFATQGDPEPALIEARARAYLRQLRLPPSVRARLFDREGGLVADSLLLADQMEITALPPPGEPGWLDRVSAMGTNLFADMSSLLSEGVDDDTLRVRTLEEEIRSALLGDRAAGQRFAETGDRVVSVTLPIQRVSAVVGVVTLEASDVSEIVRAERMALLPFIGVAVVVALLSSALLTVGVARPLRRLALAADRVRSGATRNLDLPQVSARKDEIGELAASLDGMTQALFDRITANERFAADVAHEIKNPLTSIRSAVETADRVQDEASREKLRKVIASDVRRLDRLITDISNATRLEAEFARSPRESVCLFRMLTDLTETYDAIADEDDPKVVLVPVDPGVETAEVWGREGPLGQVFRNLIENARSFSPKAGTVTVRLSVEGDARQRQLRVRVEDEGPGIPEDKLEKIFDRFYTDRPKGASFGNNSGLGLSIVRQIVEDHRGEVMAANRISEGGEVAGARFTVDLPLGTN